ncbi:MAG: cyclic-phosphate processing receiver domain-containing protein [Planctomycetota bacterium]|jgi:hypothetical protein
MDKYIAILEDDTERIAEMKNLLSSGFSDFDVVIFDNTPEMLDWLNVNFDQVSLICLDHDLGPDRMIKGQIADPGTGKDIAYYLEIQKPVCPVIIHTTNSFGRDAMKFALLDAGWKTIVVCPTPDIFWIRSSWLDSVQTCLLKDH